MVNNNRFLILPWVQVKNLASHLLACTLKLLVQDWPALYGTDPFLVEIFVDRDKFRGTCYKAANWLYLGETQGFARVDKTYIHHGNKKRVFIYLINPVFPKQITADPCRHRTPKKKPKMVTKRVPNMMLHQPDWNPELLTKIGLDIHEMEQLGSLLDEYLAYYQDCYQRSEQRDKYLPRSFFVT